MWHAKESLLLNDHECRALVNLCSPSPAMMASLYDLKIHEWDEKQKIYAISCNLKVIPNLKDHNLCHKIFIGPNYYDLPHHAILLQDRSVCSVEITYNILLVETIFHLI